MSLKILINVINQIIEAFEMDNENNAYELIKSVEPTFFKDVNIDNPKDNAEYMRVAKKLWKYQDKLNRDNPNFVRHVQNLYDACSNTV